MFNSNAKNLVVSFHLLFFFFEGSFHLLLYHAFNFLFIFKPKRRIYMEKLIWIYNLKSLCTICELYVGVLFIQTKRKIICIDNSFDCGKWHWVWECPTKIGSFDSCCLPFLTLVHYVPHAPIWPTIQQLSSFSWKQLNLCLCRIREKGRQNKHQPCAWPNSQMSNNQFFILHYIHVTYSYSFKKSMHVHK